MSIRAPLVAAALVAAAALVLACESAGGGATDAATGASPGDAAGGVAVGGDTGAAPAGDTVLAASEPQRVSVADARAWMLSDAHDTLLVCAYADPASCADRLLEGAITLVDLQAMEADLARDREIVFYCS